MPDVRISFNPSTGNLLVVLSFKDGRTVEFVVDAGGGQPATGDIAFDVSKALDDAAAQAAQ